MNNQLGKILILTGPPGAGKTTTARRLVAASDIPGVHLHSDKFWHFIRKGAIQPYLSEAHKQNEVVMSVLAKAADGYAKGGYFTVVDGIVGPWFLDIFRRLNQPLDYVILRPRLTVAIDRCRLRGGDTLADPTPIKEMHKQFSILGELDRHVIETSDMSIEETVNSVGMALASGRFQLR